ncbi:hypothetical protein LX24_00652 [Desulfallas thermosapovorans DSM 6562]|uniref:Uncharacterized protein n=1 Tax=Desulfallas thermosapovorans DSM 6562 TaxID=1121431 RepID=A0A5S4ZWQ7_9FIRM|nr:hypothetical protein LX24_00652 [Desulfallas thermosapovorans DSM 6562]
MPVPAKYVWLPVGSDETSAQYIWYSLTSQLTKIYPVAGSCR